MVNPEYPGDNYCSQCGERLTIDDIDLKECSSEHKAILRIEKIYDRVKLIENRNSNNTDDNIVCSKCGGSSLSYGFTCGLKIPEKYHNDSSVKIEKSYNICDQCGEVFYDDYREWGDFYEFLEFGDDENTYVVREKPELKEMMEQSEKERARIWKQAEDELIGERVLYAE